MPIVHLYTVCWNEADILGFFFRHYDSWVDRYVIYDDGSTDGSLDILRAHPKVDVRCFDRIDADSFVLSHRALHDNGWKESRGIADWVVVTAIDEHLWVKDRPMETYLSEQGSHGVTLIPALGFDMIAHAMPDSKALLVDTVTCGHAFANMNKLSIFNPDAVVEAGFAVGRHSAGPSGDLCLPCRDELMLWHFKRMGLERNAARHCALAERLGTKDVENQWGHRYLWTMDELRSAWDEALKQSADLSLPGFEPDQRCAGPLWWRHLSNARVADLALPSHPPSA
jgi:hypothetical protein